ncbi:hypothetical protein AALB64_12395 [Lachnospiraceae bacterium 45-P1]
MDKIGQLLERSFFGGIVIAATFAETVIFLYLIYRLIKFLQPKEVRQEEQRILSHRFYKVSGRGRVSYLILCLEETLLFYGQDFSAWKRILRELWSVTSHSEGDWIGAWLDSVGELLPRQILTTTLPSSDDIREIQDLYTRAGTKMILVNALMENAYTMVCEWSPETVAHDPDSLHFIDEAEEMMKKFGVPLPANEAVQFLFTQKDLSLGKPFDGLRLSHLSKRL